MEKNELLYAIDKYLSQSHIALIDIEYSDSVANPAFLMREAKKLIKEYDLLLTKSQEEYKILSEEYNRMNRMES